MRKNLETLKVIENNNYDYSFDYNDDPESIINLLHFLDKIIIKQLYLHFLQKLKIFSILANVYNNHQFIYYKPQIKQRIIPRENQYKEILEKYWGLIALKIRYLRRYSY